MVSGFRCRTSRISVSSNQIPFIFILLILLVNTNNLDAQVYQLDKKKDIVIGSAIIGLGLIDLKLQQDLTSLTPIQIDNLQSDQVLNIDRFATSLRSPVASNWSDYTHYATMALPLIFLTDKKNNSELASVGLMLVEAVGLNASITMLIKNVVKRERPFTYNPAVSITDKQVKSARQSFISGHASSSATLGFFSAKVFSDLYPESKWKPVMWTVGAGLPAIVSALRVRSGKHFLTDVMSGYAIGALIGYLTPQTHKRNNTSRIQIQSSHQGLISLTLALN